jgi:hypothetical protein
MRVGAGGAVGRLVAGGVVATVVATPVGFGGAPAGGCRGGCDGAVGAPVAGLEEGASMSGGSDAADALADAGGAEIVVADGGAVAGERAVEALAVAAAGCGDDERTFTTAKTPTLDPTTAAATIPKTAPREDFGTDVDVTNGADVIAAVGMGVDA